MAGVVPKSSFWHLIILIYRRCNATFTVVSSEGKTSPLESKNGKRTERGGGGGGGGGADAAGGGGAKYSMFTWFVVLALLGVWSSVAVVYFDVVDYNSVIGECDGGKVIIVNEN